MNDVGAKPYAEELPSPPTPVRHQLLQYRSCHIVKSGYETADPSCFFREVDLDLHAAAILAYRQTEFLFLAYAKI